MVTSVFRRPIRSMFRERIFARLGWISLETSRPRSPISEARWLLLPPGAAHRSSTRMPGRGAAASATDMALGS